LFGLIRGSNISGESTKAYPNAETNAAHEKVLNTVNIKSNLLNQNKLLATLVIKA
jgi:hypothetical protein